jgi:hypothetical protein
VAISLGRVLAGVIGPLLFTSVGFGANVGAAVAVDVFALVLLVVTVTEPGKKLAV